MSIKDFGERVEQRRLELGIETAAALARKAKVNRSVIYNIEQAKVGDIEVETFMKIAKALKWSPEEAFNAYDPKYKPTDSLKKDRVYQVAVDFAETLDRIGVIKR